MLATNMQVTDPQVFPFMLAEKWTDDIDPTGSWISEKLDGQRAYWDGENFWSRHGNFIHAPDWFKQLLPPFPLDGELFGGRGTFEETCGIVRSHDGGENWKKIVYCVFDAPTLDYPFEQRIAIAKNWEKTRNPPYMQVVAQAKCKGKDHMLNMLDKVIEHGGEGLMLRDPGSRYVGGRSRTLLKVKIFHDAEAIVIGYKNGTGRNADRTGSLVVEKDGIQFNVGSGLSDDLRDNPPPIGSVITYKYQGIHEKTGKPRFPSFLRARADAKQLEINPIVKETPKKPLNLIKSTPKAKEDGKKIEKEEALDDVMKEILQKTTGKENPRLPKEGANGFKDMITKTIKIMETNFVATVKNTAHGLEEGKIYRFRNTQGTYYKYWNGWVTGTTMFAEWGRIDKTHNCGEWQFENPQGAFKRLSTKINEKLRKGYVRG